MIRKFIACIVLCIIFTLGIYVEYNFKISNVINNKYTTTSDNQALPYIDVSLQLPFDVNDEYRNTFNMLIENYMDLIREFQNGNPKAVDIIYSLIPLADGSIREGIDIALGQLITKDPELFLQSLIKNKEFVQDSDIDSLVGNLSPDYIDQFELSKAEIQKRIDAIQLVNSKELQNIKQLVLKKLKNQF